MPRKQPADAKRQRLMQMGKRMTMMPAHENTYLYAMRKAQALKDFDIEGTAKRIAKRRRQRAATFIRKVT